MSRKLERETLGQRSRQYGGLKALAVLTALAPTAALAWIFAKKPAMDVAVTEVSPWSEFVKVRGQPLPVPVQWLQDEEARIAHNLMLPQGLGQVIPFDFEKAAKLAKSAQKSIGMQYFEHLCAYEAGEWIFERPGPQAGIYNARPLSLMDERQRASMYFFESPHMTLAYRLGAPELFKPSDLLGPNKPRNWFSSSSPSGHFRFEEMPTPTNEGWARAIKSKYVRIFQEYLEDVVKQDGKPGGVYWDNRSPLKIVELQKPTVLYGTTWRGLRREHDREYRIAGTEQLVYELATGKVLGLRRTFRMVRPGGTEWPGALQCGRIRVSGTDREHIQNFPMQVLPSLNRSHRRYEPPLVPSEPLPKNSEGLN